MRFRRAIYTIVAVAAVLMGQQASGQSSSINAYSPYTFYGIGDISTPGSAILRSMGGAGIGFRSAYTINSMNPASYSMIGQNSFLFNFGMEGTNVYSKSATTGTSFNTFNVRDVSIEFPVARGLGVAFSVTPYSQVGYRISKIDDRPEIVANLGHVSYNYDGSGGVSQFKLGAGWAIHPRFSIGADMIYYHGKISRAFSSTITGFTGTDTYYSVMGQDEESITSIKADIGMQANLIDTEHNRLTLGATYEFGGPLNTKVNRMVPSGNLITGDTISDESFTSKFALPSTVSVGVYYHNNRMSLGADYAYSNWGVRNAPDTDNGVAFRNTSTVRLGGEYIPSPGDIRSFFRRISYRAGLRYGQHYMTIRQQAIAEKALTFGVGVPLGMAGLSMMNLGVEFGQRGTLKAGLVKENYVKFSVEFNMFGEDYWFVKYKYD